MSEIPPASNMNPCKTHLISKTKKSGKVQAIFITKTDPGYPRFKAVERLDCSLVFK